MHLLSMLISFLIGCMLCSVVMLHTHISQSHEEGVTPITAAKSNFVHPSASQVKVTGNKGLQGLRVLVALASFDFSQFPLLEEVLDSYQDVCVAGAKIDLYIHTVVPYTGKAMMHHLNMNA